MPVITITWKPINIDNTKGIAIPIQQNTPFKAIAESISLSNKECSIGYINARKEDCERPKKKIPRPKEKISLEANIIAKPSIALNIAKYENLLHPYLSESLPIIKVDIAIVKPNMLIIFPT